MSKIINNLKLNIESKMITINYTERGINEI